MAVERIAGAFQNDSTATIQNFNSQYDVQIIDLGLLSDSAFRVVLEGEKENLDAFIEFVDDPRFVPEEPETPEEPIDPEA